MRMLLSAERHGTTSYKETLKMHKRIARQCAAALIAAICLLALPSAAASAAEAPWWNLETGSHPTNLWEPEDSIQEIKTETGAFGAALLVQVKGETVACLGSGFAAFVFCPIPAVQTAAELEPLLETAFGTTAVEVTGGPVGGDPFIVTLPGRPAPTIALKPALPPLAGNGSAQVLAPGGSGRLVVTLVNIGDAPLDATSTPLTIVDELPQGVEAMGVEGFGGAKDEAGPVECEIEASDLVTCTFEDVLTPYDAIEIEIPANLIGEPPVAGAPGQVTVSGGNGPTLSEPQSIKVSSEETPFGIEHFSSQIEEEGGGDSRKAGGHPFQLSTNLQFNTGLFEQRANRTESGVKQPAQPRNLRFPLPAGIVGNLTTLKKCSMEDFFEAGEILQRGNRCPDDSSIGAVSALIVIRGIPDVGFERLPLPVFNLPPAAGEPARFGFFFANAPTIVNTQVDPNNKYRVIASVNNMSQLPQIHSATLTIWGTPGDSAHDDSRGWPCVYVVGDAGPCQRPANLGEVPFLRNPVSCATPVDYAVDAEPWNVPFGSVVEHAFDSGPQMVGCNQVPFTPKVAAATTSQSAESPSGLDFELNMPNNGLLGKGEIAEGQAKKVEVLLPEGMTLNPSQAEGLAACSPADLARETATSAPGEGCPEASKVGSVQLSTPLLNEGAQGSLYVATPHDNPFGSLVALYLVAKFPDRGILVKQAGKVSLDPATGQVVTTFDDVPQLPFDAFSVHLFGGKKGALVLPPGCGEFAITTRFTPWNASDPDNPLPSEVITKTSTFTVNSGVNGGPCPTGAEPFKPELKAGTSKNAAGTYSPFNFRLTREDGEQEFSRFSIKLPKGVIGKLAGIPFCPDSALAVAKARSGVNAGQEEIDNPSCPAASQIGRTLVGAGVGPELSWAPGRVYLAGPYQGAKLSIVAIATAKVGPFDLGTVVIRQALRINSETAEVTSDGSSSDPIPHILEGVVVHARDIRVFIDRDNFVLNPTNCDEKAASATVVSGGGLSADVSSRFQAASCMNLGFKPKLSLQLLGGIKRTATPRLKAVVTPRKGDANIGKAQVTLPKSEFLEQDHIRTICTRAQFNAGGGNGEQCPKASIYGKARATSPLLDETLKGPVFLRSSNHELPDMVAALHSSKVDITLVGRIDSPNGGIRSTFESTPDAPVTKFVLEMQGGKKGLIVNSTNICKHKHGAIAAFTGQNGRLHEFKPVVKAQCGGKKGKKGGKGK